LTAKQFSRQPSQLLGLRDPVVALDFDNVCAVKLYEWELEQEAAKWGSGETVVEFEG
jgi:hypothetical protein